MPILMLWSAPRCRSTAFFRMMLERGDLVAVHEPFSSRAEHGSVDIAGAPARSEREVLERLRSLAATAHVFAKDTTDERYPEVLADEAFLAKDAHHTFIIRHPKETVPSYYALNSNVRRDQIGFEHLYELFDAVQQRTGRAPVVVDSDKLIAEPAATTAKYCAAVGIPFKPESLSWSPGDRAEWKATQRWHQDVSTTHGFKDGPSTHGVRLEDHPHLQGHLDYHLPFYEKLRALAL
ncbi:hypothetical protein [Pendulispora albinea]|uniref:Sulfotransferase family protein n=1 Tax=Pendulispora albinea TaxID=2741071 RepID=A0ABZ2LR78_9BACT